MGKRKRSHSSDSISSDENESLKKKIRKLKRKLRKQKQPRSSKSSSKENSPSDLRSSAYDLEYDNYEDEPVHEMKYEDLVADSNPEIPTETSGLLPNITEEIAVSLVENAVQEKTEEPLDPEKPLDPEILVMLGDDPAKEIVYGDDLHGDIVIRWTHALINGLSKESRSDLMTQYLPAKNCANMTAPKLNLEVRAALSHFIVQKDVMLQAKQNQISSCLAAIGKVLKSTISPQNSTPLPIDIIKPLGDAGRLLCDLHFKESLTRRFAIMKNLNMDTRTILKTTKIDENLFGANLSEHLKSSKAVSRSGLEMKANPPSGGSYKPPPPANQSRRGALNSRGVLPRHVAGEPRQYPTPRRATAPPRTQRRPDSYRQPQRGHRGRRYSPQPHTPRRRKE